MRKPTSVRDMDPALALRSGTFDARAVLLLWCYRKSWLPLFWIGWIGATLAGFGDTFAERTAELEGAGEWMRALATPFAGLLLSVFVRLSSGWFALALAYPLSRWTEPAHYGGSATSARFRSWMDRIYLTRAYKSLRWSWAVRRVAAERLGSTGKRLMRCGPIALWANVVLVVVWLVISALSWAGS